MHIEINMIPSIIDLKIQSLKNTTQDHRLFFWRPFEIEQAPELDRRVCAKFPKNCDRF